MFGDDPFRTDGASIRAARRLTDHMCFSAAVVKAPTAEENFILKFLPTYYDERIVSHVQTVPL